MRSKFKDEYFVTVYQLAKEGLNDTQIVQTLGIRWETFNTWRKNRPALQHALDAARKNPDTGEELTLKDYVYHHLSPDIRAIWDKVEEYNTLENGVDRVVAMLASHGKRTRQRLLVHALTSSMFNVSESIRKLGIPYTTYCNWLYHDPDFHALMDEIEWHKDNFFETSFLRRVAAGDSAAILHAARTKLKNRGYNERIEIEHTGTITHQHTIDISTLDLPLDVRKAILDAIKAKRVIEVEALPTAVGDD